MVKIHFIHKTVRKNSILEEGLQQNWYFCTFPELPRSHRGPPRSQPWRRPFFSRFSSLLLLLQSWLFKHAVHDPSSGSTKTGPASEHQKWHVIAGGPVGNEGNGRWVCSGLVQPPIWVRTQGEFPGNVLSLVFIPSSLVLHWPSVWWLSNMYRV